MTFRPAKDPGVQYERQYAKWQGYLRYADEADAIGREWEAKMWRRKARGVRSAMTRLARTAGWV